MSSLLGDELPDLYSGFTNDGGINKDPDWLKLIKSKPNEFDIGGVLLKLSHKDARLKARINQALINVLIDYDAEVSAKASMPLLGGNLDISANRNQDGDYSGKIQFRKEF